MDASHFHQTAAAVAAAATTTRAATSRSPCSTPSKRRVLGVLDGNARVSPSPSKSGLHKLPSPLKSSIKSAFTIRADTDNDENAVDKTKGCLLFSPPPTRCVGSSGPGLSPSKKTLGNSSFSSQSPSALSPPTTSDGSSRKRRCEQGEPSPAADIADSPSRKRVCLTGDDALRPAASAPSPVPARPRSASPDTDGPSVFDLSTADNTQTTLLTEPEDAVSTGPTGTGPMLAAGAVTPARRLTREQAREKAEILRLRLGLASYKVRTGQTDMPLDQLEAIARAKRRRAETVSLARESHRHPVSGPVSASSPPPMTTTMITTTAMAPKRHPLPSAPVRRPLSSAGASATLRRPSSAFHHHNHQPPYQPSHHHHHHHHRTQSDPRPRSHTYSHHHHHHQNREHDDTYPSRYQRRQSESSLLPDTAVLPTPTSATSFTSSFNRPPPPPAAAAAATVAAAVDNDAWRRSRRPRTTSAASSLASGVSLSLHSVGEEDEDEDDEDRGGAASGLLSLSQARD
ncbi:hypothetical protein VTJ49DRAFT_3740 [Mycothermus thermophilus]|uniref:Cyclin-dependent kinase n=1 Tax=Humicola insolens TaxID=85995 RepID=A0ABR3V6T6_HUMIN